MTCIALEKAGAQITELVEEADKGEEVVFTRDDLPVAKLVPMNPKKKRIEPGSAKGLILHIADDFDAPLEDFKEYME